MANWLRLRRQSHAPREQDGTETIYAAADGTLMHMDPEGTLSDLVGEGVLPSPTSEGDVLTVVDGDWAGEAPVGGSQPSSWLLGPYTFTFEDDLDALASAEGVELFTPNVGDFILPIRELVVSWDSAPGDDKLSVFDTVGTFQGAGTVLKPADHADSTNGDRLWGDDGDLAPHDESGDLVVEPTGSSSGGSWLARGTTPDAFGSLVRVKVATPLCLKMTDSEGTPIGTYEGQFEDPPVAQLLPTVGESRFYFFVWRPTLTLPS